MNDYKLTKNALYKSSIIKGVTLSALRQIKRRIHQILQQSICLFSTILSIFFSSSILSFSISIIINGNSTTIHYLHYFSSNRCFIILFFTVY